MTPHDQPPAVAPALLRPPAGRLRAGCAAGALLGALASGPAAAEITAQQVRDRFEAYGESFGLRVEAGSEEASEGTITLSDVVLSYEPEDAGGPGTEDERPGEGSGGGSESGMDALRIEATIDTMAFEERPDGSVRVTLSPESPVTVRGTDPETGEPNAIDLRLLTDGFEMTLAEAGPGAGADATAGTGWRHDYRADRLGLVLVEGTEAGEPIEGDAEIVARGLSGSGTVLSGAGPSGEATRYAESAEMAGLALRASVPIPEEEAEAGSGGAEGGRFDLAYEVADLTLATEVALADEGSMAALMSEDDPQALFEAGVSAELETTSGPSSFGLATTGGADPSDAFALEGGSDGGRARYAFDAERMEVEGDNAGLRYVVTGGGMPIERVEVALDSAEAEFGFPVGATREPEPFTLRYDLSGLTLNEELWELFDPDGRLPRDPASLLVGVEGRMRLLAGLFDEEAQARAEEEDTIPAEVEAASFELDLDALGATVEATGEFTFDDEDTTTFPGMPAPTGTMVIDATGIDALLDALTEMGLVPPDQLTPARLMLGLFARADGEGGYDSEIAVDGATGAVTANGQRLR